MMARHVSPEALKAAEEYTRKRELVRVETVGNMIFLFVGSVCVRSWDDTPAHGKLAAALAEAVRHELAGKLQQQARAVAKESRYREVKHY